MTVTSPPRRAPRSTGTPHRPRHPSLIVTTYGLTETTTSPGSTTTAVSTLGEVLSVALHLVFHNRPCVRTLCPFRVTHATPYVVSGGCTWSPTLTAGVFLLCGEYTSSKFE